MKFMVDMNLSPKWCAILQAEGWDSVHWSSVGSANAADSFARSTTRIWGDYCRKASLEGGL